MDKEIEIDKTRWEEAEQIEGQQRNNSRKYGKKEQSLRKMDWPRVIKLRKKDM